MHHDAVGLLAKRIRARLAHDPQPAERLRRVLGDRPADAGRSELLIGPRDAARDLFDKKAAVVGVRFTLKNRRDGGRRVGVRRRDEHAIGRNARGALRERFRLVHQFAGDQQAVADGDGNPRAAIVEHQAARVQRVERLGGHPVLHQAVDRDRKFRRRDVNGVRAGAKDLLRSDGSGLAADQQRRHAQCAAGQRRAPQECAPGNSFARFVHAG